MLAPSRIDWRWAKAADATQYGESQGLYQLQSHDQRVLDAYRFKRAVDLRLPLERWQSTADAYELWTCRQHERLFIEGLLLADCRDDLIADLVGCDPDDVAVYHDLFFDVRPRLRKPGWVVSQLFQGCLYQAFSPRDRVALMHRVAWLGGAEVFESFYTGRYDETIRQAMTDRIRDMLSKQTLLAAGCVTGAAELNLDLLRVFIDDTNKTVANTVDPDKGSAYSTLMSEFMAKLPPLSVADPSDKRNLTLPAREPRAHEYLPARTADVVTV